MANVKLVKGGKTVYRSNAVLKRRKGHRFATLWRNQIYYAKKRNQLTRTGELKGVDTDIAYTPVIATANTNAGVFVPNLIEQGSSFYNRIGRKIHNKYMWIKGMAYFSYSPDPTTANLDEYYLRMVVVWDKQPSGTVPNFNTIFQGTTQTGTTFDTINDPRNFGNMDRFTILRDKRYLADKMVSPYNLGTQNIITSVVLIEEYINLKGKETVYVGSSSPAVIGNISSGAIYIFFRASGNTGNKFWSIEDDTFCRLRYTD